MSTTHRPNALPLKDPATPSTTPPTAPPIAVPRPGKIAVPIVAPSIAPPFAPSIPPVHLPPILAIEEYVFFPIFRSASCKSSSIVLQSSSASSTTPAASRTRPPISTTFPIFSKFLSRSYDSLDISVCFYFSERDTCQAGASGSAWTLM